MAYKFQGKPIILFGDETHCYLEDEYGTKEYGGEYEDYSLENEDWNNHLLSCIEMSKAEFNEIFETIGGKVVTSLEDYIRYKYRP